MASPESLRPLPIVMALVVGCATHSNEVRLRPGVCAELAQAGLSCSPCSAPAQVPDNERATLARGAHQAIMIAELRRNTNDGRDWPVYYQSTSLGSYIRGPSVASQVRNVQEVDARIRGTSQVARFVDIETRDFAGRRAVLLEIREYERAWNEDTQQPFSEPPLHFIKCVQRAGETFKIDTLSEY